jgi:hypothetical protein
MSANGRAPTFASEAPKPAMLATIERRIVGSQE